MFKASHCVKSRLAVLFVVKKLQSLRVDIISSTDLHRSGADLRESLQGAADLLGRRHPGLPEKIFFRGATACVSPGDPCRLIFQRKLANYITSRRLIKIPGIIVRSVFYCLPLEVVGTINTRTNEEGELELHVVKQ